MTQVERDKYNQMLRTLRTAREWVDHWDEDRKAGLKPTESSLQYLKEKINHTIELAAAS